jgi:FAD:protein FMN transferase
VLTTDATTIDEAARVTEAMVGALDHTASRFRSDSELSRINAAASREHVQVVVSELLGGCIAAALHAADITDGLVDPTVGQAVIVAGYDEDLDAVRARRDQTALGPAVEASVPGWRVVAYDPATRLLSLPRGTVLDLGASAKAYAANLIAARLPQRLRCGFLVNLGGDIAVSGLGPVGGWDIGVEDSTASCGRSWSARAKRSPPHRRAAGPGRPPGSGDTMSSIPGPVVPLLWRGHR